MAAYDDLGENCYLEAGDNPARKTPLGVAGIDSELIIEEIMGGNDGNGGENGNNGGGGGDYHTRHGIQR